MLGATASPHLLCVGGDDHHLRIPFLLEFRRSGIRVTAAGTGDPAPFVRAGIHYCPIHIQRVVSPRADRATIRELTELLRQLCPDIVQSFDTKPNVLVPCAAQGISGLRVVRTINGTGWVYSSYSPLALMLRPVQRALHRHAARWSDMTIFQNSRDRSYFEQTGTGRARARDPHPGFRNRPGGLRSRGSRRTRAGPGLDYLPVRRGKSAESTALLSIDHMAELLRSQRASYDLIFIDSAAVLEKAEVRLLAAIAHQIVVAARWRKTRRDDVRAALALLRGCGANGGETAAPISAAVTQVARRKHVW
jgi:hypothetical protein